MKVSIKEFHDNASPFPNVYKPFDIGNKKNGREELRLAVATDDLTARGDRIYVLPAARRRRTDHLCRLSWALHPYEK